MNSPSLITLVAHGLLTLLVCWGWTVAWRRANGGAPRRVDVVQLGLVGWLLLSYVLARTGALYTPGSDGPPRIVFLLAPGALAALVLAISPFGAKLIAGLPLAWIVATQAFRLPVELLLWQLHREGVIPVQMTFEGANYDAVTALTAIVVAFACRKRVSVPLVCAWNVLGLALLARITFIAVRSMPGPWRTYTDEPANVIVLTSAFMWIPALYVLTALFAHALVFRALFTRRASG